MTLEEIKSYLKESDTIAFELPDGSLVPRHFHVTEVGRVVKDFIDCGGKIRKEVKANFQLWEADDYDHRLHPEKLVHIIELSQRVLEMGDLDIEVEYQGETIGRFDLGYNGQSFQLLPLHTNCLAREQCGIPSVETERGELPLAVSSSCAPGSGCC